MKMTFVKEVTLYQYRYLVGYIVIVVLLLGLLMLGLDQAPRGLTKDEMDSAVTSINVNVFNPIVTNVVDAPYHILQKVSIHYLGLSPTAIKLPSIVIGVMTGFGIILMLQKWFRKNVAIITALIIVTSTGFLGIARTGTPLIMTAFWTVMLLWGATHVLHAEKHTFIWKLFCFVSIALLAYSPFGIYPLLVMVIAGVFHPHVRNRLKQGVWWHHTVSVFAILLVIGPLLAAVIHTPSIGMQLLGLDKLNEFQWQQFIPNAISTFDNLFNFTNNSSNLIATPMFSIATTILLLLGLLKLFTASYSARSYMLFIWIVLLFVVLTLRPDMLLLVIVPATLILAIGMETLIRLWYDLFPRNPYARIAALIPLSILLISIVDINIERYFYGYHYSPLTSEFHPELPAVRNSLSSRQLGKTNPVVLSVPASQASFYNILHREYPKLTVNTDPSSSTLPIIVLNDTKPQLENKTPTQIITNDLSKEDQAVLLRVYSK